MSLKEESTDGNTGMEAAEKHKTGTNPKPIHGYGGRKGYGSSSLINHKQEEYQGEELKEPAKSEIKDAFPFMGEEEQEKKKVIGFGDC